MFLGILSALKSQYILHSHGEKDHLHFGVLLDHKALTMLVLILSYQFSF